MLQEREKALYLRPEEGENTSTGGCSAESEQQGPVFFDRVGVKTKVAGV